MTNGFVPEGDSSYLGYLNSARLEMPQEDISNEQILAIKDPSERTKRCFLQYGPMVYNYVLKELKYDKDTAETITQEAFLALHNKFQDNNNPITESASGYLFRIVKNLINSHYRGGDKLVVMEHLPDDPDEKNLLDLDKELLFEAIKKLGDEQRVVIEKKYQGFTNIEIAKQLETTVGAVKQRYNRALDELARLLRHEFPERQNNPTKKESKK